jgi:Asp/Glu/hydantoin racemase
MSHRGKVDGPPDLDRLRVASQRRIFYESLVDPEHGADYLSCLGEALRVRAGDHVRVTVAGRQSGLYGLPDSRSVELTYASVKMAHAAGFDAFILGNFSDAGVREARARAEITVVGLRESTLEAAAQFGRPIGLVGLESGPPVVMGSELLSSIGLREADILIESSALQPNQLVQAFSREQQAKVSLSRFLETAERLRARGARPLVPAGGVLMVMLDRQGVTSAAGLPIIDGLRAALRRAMSENPNESETAYLESPR